MMRLPVASKAALVSLAGRLGNKRLDEFSGSDQTAPIVLAATVEAFE